MDVTEALQNGNSFSASFNYAVDKPIKGMTALDPSKYAVHVTLSALAHSTLSIDAIMTTKKQAPVVSGARTNIIVKALKVPVGYVITGGVIPDNVESLPAWELSFSKTILVPADSNLYSGKISRDIDIPVMSGNYIIIISVDRLIYFANAASHDNQIDARIEERVSFSGAPVSDEMQALSAIITQIQSITTQLAGLTTIETNEHTDYSASFAAISTKLDTLHADLA